MLQDRHIVIPASQSCPGLFSIPVPANLLPQPELSSPIPISWFPEAAVFVLQLIVVVVVVVVMSLM